MANIDLTKFNAAQQTELANSKFMQTMTVTDFNANQQSAIQNATDVQKFNNELVTKINQFDSELEYKTDLWNAQNEQAVEQSNIAWRRKANTIDTAAQNAANATAANFAFNMTSAEQNFLWQQARDTAAFAQQSLETKKERAMQLLSSLYGNTELMKDGIAKSGVSSLSAKLEQIIGI